MRQGGRPRELAGSWEWLEYAARLPASHHSLVNVNTSGLIYKGRHILTGGFVTNSASSAGSVALYDGEDASGALVGVIPLTAGGQGNADVPSNGVIMDIGLFILPVSVILRGSFFIIPLFHYPFTEPGR